MQLRRWGNSAPEPPKGHHQGCEDLLPLPSVATGPGYLQDSWGAVSERDECARNRSVQREGGRWYAVLSPLQFVGCT